MSVGEKLCR